VKVELATLGRDLERLGYHKVRKDLRDMGYIVGMHELATQVSPQEALPRCRAAGRHPLSAIARFGHGFCGLLGGTLHENAVADQQKEPRASTR
jgi:hypothetical protein